MNRKTTFILSAACCLLALAACSNPAGGADTAVKLTYSANNADSGDVPAGAKEYSPGDTVTVAGNTGNLGRTGFVYAGWNTKPDRSGDSYVEGDKLTIGSGDVTLYAKWDEIIAGFSYETSEGKVTITKYTGSDPSVTIPATINGLPVTAIGARAFMDCASLASVTIPKSATFIGDYAFYGCTILDTLTFSAPSSLTAMGEYVFAHCSNLASATLPGSVTYISDGAFYDCSKLASVAIPSSVTALGSHAFSSCPNLASIDIPSSVTSIGSNAFQQCTKLASVTIPASVTSIGLLAFYVCPILAEVHVKRYVPGGSPEITAAGVEVFEGNAAGRIIYVPSAAAALYKADAAWSAYETAVPGSIQGE